MLESAVILLRLPHWPFIWSMPHDQDDQCVLIYMITRFKMFEPFLPFVKMKTVSKVGLLAPRAVDFAR